MSQCDTFIAYGNGSHNAQFDNVVFVIDDLQGPLRDVVTSGLKASADAGFRTVTLPTMRLGSALGLVESSTEEVVEEITAGVRNFQSSDRSLESIAFVVHGNMELVRLLEDAFAQL